MRKWLTAVTLCGMLSITTGCTMADLLQMLSSAGRIADEMRRSHPDYGFGGGTPYYGASSSYRRPAYR